MIFLADQAAGGFLQGGGLLILYVVVFGAFIYFAIMRPQKNEQKRMSAMLSELAVGDSILTNSGFYGVVLDIQDDTVIVEFGSNKNCRIPMQKTAIAQVEKSEQESSQK